MLSILIPIYNCDVVALVETLYQQCLSSVITFEIICFDDGSTASYKTSNRHINVYPNVCYKELPENLGRSKIRNALAAQAQYPYLLFMDADAKVISPQYLQNYLDKLGSDTLVYGGCVYKELPPTDKQKLLHYYYGKNREEILTEKRKLSPYASFKTFNFLIPKVLFDGIQFEESIRQYGHEDTLFGIELERKHIPILHINNPLEHLGLEDASIFLAKQRQAISTLYQLYLENRHLDSRLIRTFKCCKKLGVQNVVSRILKLLLPFIHWQLRQPKPQIICLDLYKLYYLLQASE